MAKAPVIPQSADLSFDQIKRAIPRLEKRITELEAFRPESLTERGAPEVVALRTSIEQTLRDIFGPNTAEYQHYQSAVRLDGGPIQMASSWVTARTGHRSENYEYRRYYAQSRDRAVAVLKQVVSGLRERVDDMDDSRSPSVDTEDQRITAVSNRVFIVHGRDDGPREAVARFLEKMGLEPVILHERPNKGRTLISKFQDEAADIGFAVVLMTPDDTGAKSGEEPRPRARQNVVFELGFFIGAIGSERVAAITDSSVERPSDFEGVVYIPWDNEWKTKLAKELDAAGYAVDWNKVMRS